MKTAHTRRCTGSAGNGTCVPVTFVWATNKNRGDFFIVKISELPSTIERAWNFVAPLFVEAFTAILIVILIAGNAPLHALSAIRSPYLDMLKDPEVIKLLSIYGIITLMPIILLFILLTVIYAFDKVAHLIGDLFSIIAWDHNVMMARNVSPYLVADVWKYYPNINNVPDLNRLIDERLGRAKLENDPLFATAIFYEELFSKLHGYLRFLQFLIIEAAIIPFIPFAGAASKTPDWTMLFPNSFLVIISLLIIYALVVRQQAYYLKQLVFFKVSAMRTSLQVQMQRTAQPEEERRLGLRQQQCKDEFKDVKKDRVISLHYNWK
ncbi:MAG: hypothetical protein ABII79_09365 [bacterium]